MVDVISWINWIDDSFVALTERYCSWQHRQRPDWVELHSTAVCQSFFWWFRTIDPVSLL